MPHREECDRPGCQPAASVRLDLANSLSAPKAARHVIEDLLGDQSAGFMDDALLMTSELVTRQVLVRVVYLSLDPYMRGRMRDGASYAAPVGLGEVMPGGTVGEVVRSNHAGFKPGDIVEDRLGWQEYGLTNGATLRKIDPSVAPISTANGVLGMPGMTAWFVALFRPGSMSARFASSREHGCQPSLA